MRRRANKIIIRVNDEELSLLRRKVQESGLSMTKFFRTVIVSGEVKPLPPELVTDMQRQIRGIGRNVNQITKLAHISGKVSMETLRQISAAQEKIEKLLARLE